MPAWRSWDLLVRAAVLSVVGVTPCTMGSAADERVPLLQATLSIEPDSLDPVFRQSDIVLPAGQEGLLAFWRRHRYHLLTVILADKVKSYYRNEIGIPEEPLFFGGPLGIDEAVYDRTFEEDPSSNVLVDHMDESTRVVALGVILASEGRRWGSLADDLLGFYEADEFNRSVTSLVKTVFGRRRPDLDQAEPAVLGLEEYGELEECCGNRKSFYSQAASRAFTHMSYADRVLADRLRDHPRARVWSGIGLYGLASYLAYTRLEKGKHYFSDVVAGAGAGILVGRSFYRVNNEPHPDGNESRVKLNPPSLLPGGVEISLSVRF